MKDLVDHIALEVNKYRNEQDGNKILFELVPASKVTENVYDYCISGRYFNEILSIVSGLRWDKIYHGYQYLYSYNSMQLCIGPEGKISVFIPKTYSESFWIYDKLIDPVINPSGETMETNFRFRVHSKDLLNIDYFPPSNMFHNKEKIVYRNYSDKNVNMQFEIIRPMDCHKKFDELLYIKNDSKYMIRIQIKNVTGLDKYIKTFFPTDTDPKLSSK